MNNRPDQRRFIQSKSIGRDQLITLGDLADFKLELLNDLRSFSKEIHNQHSKSWLKSHEVRKLLGISPGTLQSLRDNGTIPFTRLGNVMFYNADDINNMMDRYKNKSI